MRRLYSTPAAPAEDREIAAELVSRVLEGDTDAFRPLVEAFEPSVFGLCRKLCPREDAEDLAQETFVQAYRYLPRLEDPTRFAPWIYQIARSLCRVRRRHRAVEKRALENRAEFQRRVEVPEALDANAVDAVTGALAELPEAERQILELRYYQGLSFKDIASRLGTTFARVDHTLRKARSRLARRLEARRARDGAL